VCMCMYLCMFRYLHSMTVVTVLSFFKAWPCNTDLTQLNSCSTVNPTKVPVIRKFHGCLTYQTLLGYAPVMMH